MQLEFSEIGGYFEFSLSNSAQFPYPNAFKYHSARSAFYDLIRKSKIKKIWMPRFICDSMLEPLRLLNIDVLFYNLHTNFFPILPEKLNKDEYLFYVNYFGICGSVQKELLNLYPSQQVIFDHAQAFFVEPLNCFATLYSPRKFLPVAEGGLLITEQNFMPTYDSRNVDEMVQQYQHSLIRRLTSASLAYDKFKKNENKFNDCLPKRLSGITEEILNSLNYESFKEKRLENFRFLHNKLGRFNQLKINLDQLESPLTYPFLLNEEISTCLINAKVYIPTYWSDSLSRVGVNSFEHKLVSQASHLICDQRYSKEEMQHQVDIIQDYLK